MRYLSRGFTLVELMIVVAILGVLATIAVPLYTDYMNRSKVSEAMILLGGLKNPMVEYYLANVRWPAVNSVGGRDGGQYVEMITSGGPATLEGKEVFFVEATMKGPGPLTDKQVRMAYEPNSRDWFCTVEGTANPIPIDYLPATCK